MDYGEEFEKLNMGSDAWKPELGINNVVILGEPETTEFVDEKTGHITPQIKMRVSVKGEEKEWYVPVGKTNQSCYGQLMALGKFKGKLAGEVLTVLVNKVKNRSGTERNSYIIQEALAAIKLFEERAANKIDDKDVKVGAAAPSSFSAGIDEGIQVEKVEG